ncbi:MAG: DEAD/DEAH box helicase family protein [Limnohabitans sp.]
MQHLQGNQVDTSARVVICTIQRMFSLLKGKELPPEADEESAEGAESLFKDPEPIGYNPAFPIELFDIVVTDEAHRSIYNLWRQVLEYFDSYLVGLTATPNKQTFGFFNQNLVMEYGHTQAVADGVNVNYDVYRIQTEVTEKGAKVEKGFWLETVDKASVAAATGHKAQHIRNRGLDNRYYRDLIVDLVREHQPVAREDIDKLLLDKLPEVLSTEQKASKIHNLLTSLSGKRIQNVGTRQASRWVLFPAQQQ